MKNDSYITIQFICKTIHRYIQLLNVKIDTKAQYKVEKFKFTLWSCISGNTVILSLVT